MHIEAAKIHLKSRDSEIPPTEGLKDSAEKKRLTKIKIARIILAQTVSGLYQHTSITDGEGHNDTQTAIPF